MPDHGPSPGTFAAARRDWREPGRKNPRMGEERGRDAWILQEDELSGQRLVIEGGTQNPPLSQLSAVLLEGRPGDRVSISCTGISQATRWVWAPTYPGCIGLSPGRRPVVWASPPANLTRASTSRFAGRLRVVSPSGIQQLELLLARGDSGTFFCLGTGVRQGNESRTCLTVLGDKAACRASRPTSGSSYPLFLYPLLGIGLALGLTGLGMAWRLRQKLPSGLVRTNPARGENSSSPQLHSVTGHVPSSHPSALHPFPKTKDPSMDTEIQSRWKKETRETENLEDEKSLLYADLEHIPLRNPKNTIPKDAGTIYAIVV